MTTLLLVASLAAFLGIGVFGALYGARGLGEGGGGGGWRAGGRDGGGGGWARPGSLTWWMEDIPPAWTLGLATAMGLWILAWVVVLLVGLSLIFSA